MQVNCCVGMMSMRGFCHGGFRQASGQSSCGRKWLKTGPTPIISGCRKLCCSKPWSKLCVLISRFFCAHGPSIFELAACDQEEVLRRWAGLGYYARARNLHACAGVVVARHKGIFPQSEKQLLALPGIGPYTASAIRAIAFDQKAVVVDGNVERVVARLYALKKPLAQIKPLLKKTGRRIDPE